MNHDVDNHNHYVINFKMKKSWSDIRNRYFIMWKHKLHDQIWDVNLCATVADDVRLINLFCDFMYVYFPVYLNLKKWYIYCTVQVSLLG